MSDDPARPETPAPLNRPAQPAPEPEVEAEVEEEVEALVDEEPADAGAPADDAGALAAAAMASAPGAAWRLVTRRKPKGSPLKATAAPILLTVGLLLLFPATWAALYFAGFEVFGSERPDVRSMAMLMLICWPIAISLLGAAIVFFVQVSREKAMARP